MQPIPSPLSALLVAPPVPVRTPLADPAFGGGRKPALASAAWAAALLALVHAGTGQAQQNSPNAEANANSRSTGTTVNNQTNLQINNTAFFGYGPGVSCPTPSLTMGLFSSRGTGRSTGDRRGASQDSSALGGVLIVSMPLGGANAGICQAIGERRVQTLLGEATALQAEAARTGGDITMAIAEQCLQAKQQATLIGAFARLCSGVSLPGERAATQQPPLVLQRFQP